MIETVGMAARTIATAVWMSAIIFCATKLFQLKESAKSKNIKKKLKLEDLEFVLNDKATVRMFLADESREVTMAYGEADSWKTWKLFFSNLEWGSEVVSITNTMNADGECEDIGIIIKQQRR